MHLLRRSTALVALAATVTVTVTAAMTAAVATSPANAAPDTWTAPDEVGGHALAVALDDGSTALISVGGDDDATIYDRRRAADGTWGPTRAVTTVSRAERCAPVEAATAGGNVAVAVQCATRTGLEDPPTTLAELVWTGDDGWVWKVKRTASLGSVDYSPRGQFAVFATDIEYAGRPHHITSYHTDLGWRDVRRREIGSSGDDIVAAINDAGDVVVLRGAGDEIEPGSWYAGRLRIETYDRATRAWTRRSTQHYPDGGITPLGIDMVGGRFAATVTESRSTGKLRGLEDRVLLLSGRPAAPRTWRAPRWTQQVFTGRAALTSDGVVVAAWQARSAPGTATASLATWTEAQSRPTVRGLEPTATLTYAVESGVGMDLSVTASGRGALAWVARERGADTSSVRATSFRVGADGRIGERVAASWSRPVNATVAVTAGDGGSSATLGRLLSWGYPAPDSAYVLGP